MAKFATATSAMLESSKAGQAYTDMMMSDNKHDACYGRMMSRLTPVLQQLINEERQRNTDPNILVNIAPGVAVSLLFQLLPPFAFPKTDELLIQTAEDLLNNYKQGSVQYLQALKEQS